MKPVLSGPPVTSEGPKGVHLPLTPTGSPFDK